MISLLSLIFTLFLVRFIKSYNTSENNTYNPLFYDALRNGRSAYSLTFNLEDIPVDLVFPGVKVDLIEKTLEDVKYLVRNVFVVSVSFIENGEKVKIDLALNEIEIKNILLSNSKNLSLSVKGELEKEEEGLEIIEL